MHEPLYYAVCRDCGPARRPNPDCWICSGTAFYPVRTIEQADVILRLTVTGTTVGFTSEQTDRLTTWLASHER